MKCTHCSNEVEFSDTDVLEYLTCERCEMVLSHVCKVDRKFRPDDASILAVRGVLEGVDRTDDDEVWKALIYAGPSIADVQALKQSKKPIKFSRWQQSKWKQYYVEWKSNTEDLSFEKLPLPGSKEISIRTQGDTFGERKHKFCQEPLADLSEYFIKLSGSTSEFTDWFELTKLLKITTKTLINHEISTHAWFQGAFTECLPPFYDEGIDETMLLFDPPHGRLGRSHPFIRYAASLVNNNIMNLFCHPNTEDLPKMWLKAERQLGSIATSWKSILESDNPSVRKSNQGPSLVVNQQRLHLVVRGEHGYSLKQLPQNMDVWRHLLGWSLFHPATEQNNYLRAIQWVIDYDGYSIPIAPKPEFRALALLGQACKSLGESVIQTNNDGFIVEGTSSLWYSVRPLRTTTYSAIEVHAFRNKKAALSWNKPIKICIQLMELTMDEYPLADKLAAYLLTLRNDQGSAEHITTLLMLHQNWFENTTGNSAKDWSKISKNHPYGFHDDDDDEWDGDWEDEVFDIDDETHPPFGQELEEQNRLFFEWLESDDGNGELVISVHNRLEDEPVEDGHTTSEEDVWKFEAEVRGEHHCIRGRH
ncbi:MAG TPA: hypothetical protein EYQ78_05875 [Candidatus Poseidoniales archaeon]|nr:hypothetical protein [Candidatus Poseidoniales archaeon]